MAKFAVILPAAGRSERFGGGKEKKIFSELDGRAVWLRAIDPFLKREDVGQMIVVIAPDDQELFECRFRANVAFLGIKVVEGGQERSASIANALDQLDPSCDFVAIHDAARPCLAEEWVAAVFEAAKLHGAALLAIPVTDTLKRSEDGLVVSETVARSRLHRAQTPQVFRTDWIREAYRMRGALGEHITDDAQLVEALGKTVRLVEGSPLNVKITTQADLVLARAALQVLPKPKTENVLHPFGDDREMWSDKPRQKPPS